MGKHVFQFEVNSKLEDLKTYVFTCSKWKMSLYLHVLEVGAAGLLALGPAGAVRLLARVFFFNLLFYAMHRVKRCANLVELEKMLQNEILMDL